MSVLKKLMAARLRLQATKLNKSGHNKFAGYEYFELGDFIPAVQTIFSDLGLCGVVSYAPDLASLTITSIEDGTTVVITSPMSSAALKGCHEVQNLGAVQSYLRRYLWVTAMEIVEHDALDATTGSEKSKVVPTKTGWEPNEEELEHLNKELSTIMDKMDNEGAKSASAYFYRDGGLDEEEKLWVWNKLAKSVKDSIKQNKEKQ